MNEKNSFASKLPWMGWILAAIFAAAFLVVSGMFVMYVWMTSATVVSNQNPEAPVGVSKNMSGADHAAVSRIEEKQPLKTVPNPPTHTLPNLPSLTEMQKSQLDIAGLKHEFDWSDEMLAYQFLFKIDAPDEALQFSGRTTFSPSKLEPEKLLADEIPQESTGTGFVIHPEGLILTCAHVVENAELIEIALEGVVHKATIIAVDQQNDLALIRVKTNNAKYLSIATPNSVEQGEPVRVAGFPLTELLGSSLKISSGSIIGFSDGTGEVQIDASVNPGNSGGPVVDDNGVVIGVASALLDAEGISSVGLAVGVKQISNFLLKCKAPFVNGAITRTNDEIKKSVVFIRSSGQKMDLSKSKVISYVSSYQQIRNRRNGIPSFAMLSDPGASDGDKGAIVFDSRGVLGNSKPSQKTLPLFFKKLCLIGVEQLPKSDARRSWSETTSFVIEQTRQEPDNRYRSPLESFHSRRIMMNPMFHGSQHVREKTVAIIVNQTSHFRIKSDYDGELVVNKSFKIETVQSPDSSFDVAMEYTGDFTFDKIEKRIKRGKYKGHATLPIAGNQQKIPLQLDFNVISNSVLEQEKLAKAAKAKADKERKKRVDDVTVKTFDLYDPDK